MKQDGREKWVELVLATSIVLTLNHQLIFSNSPYNKKVNGNIISKNIKTEYEKNIDIYTKINQDNGVKIGLLMGNSTHLIQENTRKIVQRNIKFNKYKHNQKVKFSRGEGSVKEYIEFVKKIREKKDSKIIKKIKQTQERKKYKLTYRNNEIIYLARLISAEALNQPYVGKVAVGSIVTNRMKKYKASLYEVINARNQFSSVGTRNFNRVPNKECIKAAKDALNGRKPLGDKVIYYANMRDINSSNRRWFNSLTFVGMIGNHSFFRK